MLEMSVLVKKLTMIQYPYLGQGSNSEDEYFSITPFQKFYTLKKFSLQKTEDDLFYKKNINI